MTRRKRICPHERARCRTAVFNHAKLLTDEQYVDVARKLLIETLQKRIDQPLREFIVDVLSGGNFYGRPLEMGHNTPNRGAKISLLSDFYNVSVGRRTRFMFVPHIYNRYHPSHDYIHESYLS